jgi:hypothetical protein
MTINLTRRNLRIMIKEAWKDIEQEPRDTSWDKMGDPDWSTQDDTAKPRNIAKTASAPKKKPIEEGLGIGSLVRTFCTSANKSSPGISEKELVRLCAFMDIKFGPVRFERALSDYLDRYYP